MLAVHASRYSIAPPSGDEFLSCLRIAW